MRRIGRPAVSTHAPGFDGRLMPELLGRHRVVAGHAQGAQIVVVVIAAPEGERIGMVDPEALGLAHPATAAAGEAVPNEDALAPRHAGSATETVSHRRPSVAAGRKAYPPTSGRSPNKVEHLGTPHT